MAAENEAKNARGDGNKRKRRYLPHNRPVKKKGPRPIWPGVQGFFITCDGGRERQAAQEAINIIDSYLEELIDGKDSGAEMAAIPKKPMNKKIKFTYSDSSDDEDADDDEEEEEQKNKSEMPAENGADDGSTAEETPDHAKKDNQVNEVGSGQTVGDDKEADIQQANSISEENEEPPEKKQCCDAKKLESRNHVSATTEKSVDKLIEEELKELGDKSKRRFSQLDTGCNGVVFVLMRRKVGDPGPRDIVQRMMESAAATKKHMSRFLLRVVPVELSCYASDEEISKAIKPLIEESFPENAEAPVKFAVQYDARANTGIDRMKIIDAVAKTVPGPHKVDLKNPQKTIIVQIVKTVCMIGVVEKYKELAKYNLRQLTSPNLSSAFK